MRTDGSDTVVEYIISHNVRDVRMFGNIRSIIANKITERLTSIS